jgi:hypothetical protein
MLWFRPVLIEKNPFGPNTDVVDPDVGSPTLALEMCPCGYFILFTHNHHPETEQLIRELGGLEKFSFDRSFSRTVIAFYSENKTHFIAALFDANKPIVPGSAYRFYCKSKLLHTYEQFAQQIRDEVQLNEPRSNEAQSNEPRVFPFRFRPSRKHIEPYPRHPSYPSVEKFKDWLKKKVTAGEAEANHMQPEEPGSEPIPFGLANSRWKGMLMEMKSGDEIWEFSAPVIAGPSGMALVRGRQIVKWLTLAGKWGE